MAFILATRVVFDKFQQHPTVLSRQRRESDSHRAPSVWTDFPEKNIWKLLPESGVPKIPQQGLAHGTRPFCTTAPRAETDPSRRCFWTPTPTSTPETSSLTRRTWPRRFAARGDITKKIG